MIQGHFGDQALKAAAGFRGPTALSQVFVDDHDTLTLPTEGDRLLGQSILSRGGLSMFQNLCRRRLPHIDDGELFQVVGANLGTRSTQQSVWRSWSRACGSVWLN